MNYWLFKSEPSDYSFDNFISDKETCWEGIRNYQARNFIRDDIKKNDEVYKVGCLGKIVSFKETNDKRFLIELKGLIRFDIENEVKSEKIMLVK